MSQVTSSFASRVSRFASFLFLLLGAVLPSFGAKPVLTGDKCHFWDGIYLPQDKVTLIFRVSGLEPKKPGPDIRVRVVDEYERPIAAVTLPVLADKSGCDEVYWHKAPCGRLGFYRVYAELADGTKLHSPWASARDGEMTYAVVRDPKEREYVDESIIKFYHQSDPRIRGPLLPRQKVSGLRGDAVAGEWPHIDARGIGSYASDPDNASIPLGQHLMLLGFSRKWAKADCERCFRMEKFPGSGARIPGFTDEGLREWERFLRAFVPNYRRQYADALPRLYEISSEVDPVPNGAITMEDILKVYEVSQRVIHELDPEGTVCGVGHSISLKHGLTTPFLKAGVGKYLDALTTHAYCGAFPPEQHRLVDKVRDAIRSVRELTGRDLPIYNTEAGYWTFDRAEEEPVQMMMCARTQLIFLGEGFRSLSLFHQIDYRVQPGYGYAYNLHYGHDFDYYGKDFGSPKKSPKPVWPAMSALTWFVANQRPCGDIPFLGETCCGYVFRHAKKGTVNLALWDWAKKPMAPHRLRLKVGAKEIGVADHMGNLRQVKPDAQGEVELGLYDMPTYLFGVDPQIWEDPQGERVQMAKAFRERQRAERRARGVEIVTVRPALAADGTAGVEVELRDISEADHAGEIAVELPRLGVTCRAPYAVKAERRSTTVVPLGNAKPHAFLLEDLIVRATPAGKKSVEKRETANFLVAKRLTGFSIDGDFAKWAKVGPVELDPKTQVQNCPKNYKPGDQFVKCAFGYDEKGLLFYFDVDDDLYKTASPKRPEGCWSSDSVQIALAKVYRYEEQGNTLLDQMNEAKSLYTFALTPEQIAYRHLSYDREMSKPAHPVAQVAVNDGKSGYEMQTKVEKLANGRTRHRWEIRMPWHAVNMAAGKPGDRLGFSFCVNDFDGDVKDWEGGVYTSMGAFHLHMSHLMGALLLGR